jgi:thioredoxin-dependent peroxiredoxin
MGARKVLLLPDGNGEFTRKMGRLIDLSNLGFGLRSWRYSVLVNDGVIVKSFIGEPQGTVSAPRLAFVG